MFKLLIAGIFLVIALVGGIAFALYHFLGWKGLLALPLVLFALLRIGKVIARPIFGRFGLGLFSAKAEALRDATITVHSISAVPVPVAGEDEEKPEEPKHYYDVDLTITPHVSASKNVWEPAELVLRSKKVSTVYELREEAAGFADQVLVWNGSEFGPDDPGKYSGMTRLKITFAVKPGTSPALLHYYDESIGSLDLPAWTCENDPPRKRAAERTEHSRRAAAPSQEALATAKQARRGDNFETGSGKAEPQLRLYQPPDDYLSEPIDMDKPMDEVDAVLDRIDARRLDSLPLGASRFGGVPDLPPDVPWPDLEGRKLPLLAQIDLSTLPKSALPSEGWLFAFGLCDDEHSPMPIRVLHHNGPRAELVRAARPPEKQIWKDWSENRIYNVVTLKAAKENGWEECGWLLGEIDEAGQDAASVADGQDCSGDDWITLMIIPSAGSMAWSDGGLFHIVIRREDLAQHDFSKVCAGLSCVG